MWGWWIPEFCVEEMNVARSLSSFCDGGGDEFKLEVQVPDNSQAEDFEEREDCASENVESVFVVTIRMTRGGLFRPHERSRCQACAKGILGEPVVRDMQMW